MKVFFLFFALSALPLLGQEALGAPRSAVREDGVENTADPDDGEREGEPEAAASEGSLSGELCSHARVLADLLKLVVDADSADKRLGDIRDELNQVGFFSDAMEERGEALGEEAGGLVDAIVAEVQRIAEADFYGDLYLRQILEQSDEVSGESSPPVFLEESLATAKRHFEALRDALSAIRDEASARGSLSGLQASLKPLDAAVEEALLHAEPPVLQESLGGVIEEVVREAARIRDASFYNVAELAEQLKEFAVLCL